MPIKDDQKKSTINLCWLFCFFHHSSLFLLKLENLMKIIALTINQKFSICFIALGLSVIMMMMLVSKNPNKIGYYYSDSIIISQGTTKQLDSNIKMFVADLQQTYSSMTEELKSKKKELSADSAKKTSNPTLVKEISDLQAKISKFQASANQKIAAQEASLVSPIVSEIKRNVKVIAEEKGYNYVFDASTTKIPYLNSKDNITETLKRSFKQ